MGIFFRSFDSAVCCLCGNPGKLTGEHKIKASMLRKEFGKADLVVGGNSDKPKFAQSTNSKHLKFHIRICERCNTVRTQQADREFDKLHSQASELSDVGRAPVDAFSGSRYGVGTSAYLNVFRYFAKLLCCHIAEVQGPTPLRLSKFAVGDSDRNCIFLAIHEDWTYQQTRELIGDHEYSAHGGLIVYGHKKTGRARGFHSTLTIGHLQYVFYTRLTRLERVELRALYPSFNKWCSDEVAKVKLSPLSPQEMKATGLR